VVRSFSLWQVNTLIQEFWWTLRQPADATFALCNRKGWIEQLADLLNCQIFDFNGVASSGAEEIDRWRRA
jgi:hypothetical protein